MIMNLNKYSKYAEPRGQLLLPSGVKVLQMIDSSKFDAMIQSFELDLDEETRKKVRAGRLNPELIKSLQEAFTLAAGPLKLELGIGKAVRKYDTDSSGQLSKREFRLLVRKDLEISYITCSDP